MITARRSARRLSGNAMHLSQIQLLAPTIGRRPVGGSGIDAALVMLGIVSVAAKASGAKVFGRCVGINGIVGVLEWSLRVVLSVMIMLRWHMQ